MQNANCIRAGLAAGCAGVPAARVKQEEQTDALSCAHLGWCEIALAPPPRLNRLASHSKLTKTLAERREVFPPVAHNSTARAWWENRAATLMLWNYLTYAGESKPHMEETTQSAAHAICLIESGRMIYIIMRVYIALHAFQICGKRSYRFINDERAAPKMERKLFQNLIHAKYGFWMQGVSFKRCETPLKCIPIWFKADSTRT
jgi:hypothetical protein